MENDAVALGDVLLHREGARPGVIVLRLVLIRMVLLRFGVNVYLSVIKLLGDLDDTHARQACSMDACTGVSSKRSGWLRAQVWRKQVGIEVAGND